MVGKGEGVPGSAVMGNGMAVGKGEARQGDGQGKVVGRVRWWAREG